MNTPCKCELFQDFQDWSRKDDNQLRDSNILKRLVTRHKLQFISYLYLEITSNTQFI